MLIEYPKRNTITKQKSIYRIDKIFDHLFCQQHFRISNQKNYQFFSIVEKKTLTTRANDAQIIVIVNIIIISGGDDDENHKLTNERCEKGADKFKFFSFSFLKQQQNWILPCGNKNNNYYFFSIGPKSKTKQNNKQNLIKSFEKFREIFF